MLDSQLDAGCQKVRQSTTFNKRISNISMFFRQSCHVSFLPTREYRDLAQDVHGGNLRTTSTLNYRTMFQGLKVTYSIWGLTFSCALANGHIMLNTPVLVRSLKLSNIEPSQYLDGWPPGNTGCCWLSFFSLFKTIFAFFGWIWVIKYTLALFLVLVHLKIHGNWSKFKENPFSRGFVALFETFWRFFKVSESK